MSELKARVHGVKGLTGNVEIRFMGHKEPSDYYANDAELIYAVLGNCLPNGTVRELQKILNELHPETKKA